MNTIWGETLDREHPLPEYPRPQLARESYYNLNGVWQYAFTHADALPEAWEGEIVVPFSPESALSGVGRALHAGETLWYARAVTLPRGFCKGRVLLHFGAVDQEAAVFVNEALVSMHTGGYLPFSADITDALPALRSGEESPALTFTLTVRVKDDTDASYHARGKQKRKKGGIWYTPQSGIWQTVWLESVPRAYIEGLRITPLFDESAVELTVYADADAVCTARIGDIVAQLRPNEPARISLLGFTPWSPENPHLYDLRVQMGEDAVQSYFGMRKIEIREDGNTKRIFLNDAPYFCMGVLDQGYWPDGLYTAPADAAMVFDIQTMKDAGFNTLRKHVKVEPLRWYYHCDRLGMLVWQDAVNGGGKYGFSTVTLPALTQRHRRDDDYARFGRADAAGRREYLRELGEMAALLYNAPSLVLWTPFNEGWGQFDAAETAALLQAMDPTRLIDHASGWHDQGTGEIKSLHVYFKPYVYAPDARAVVLSECGGYALSVAGHSTQARTFGYKRCKTPEALLAALRKLYEEQLCPAREQGLAAAIYTQLSDVEGERNGLLTYDRQALKLPVETLRALNAGICGN